MATADKEPVKVSPEEIYESTEGGFPGSSAVKVDGLEEAKPKDDAPTDKAGEEVKQPSDAPKQSAPTTHETEKVKTSVTDEEYKPSMKDKLMGKVVKVGDKLRPKDAVEAKNADPHPELT